LDNLQPPVDFKPAFVLKKVIGGGSMNLKKQLEKLLNNTTK
jgi:hypothetical protein